jgi:DNA polymerase III alpha subunit
LLDQYPASRSSRFDKLSELVEERELECFVLAKDYKQIVTKKGDDMAFIKVQDNYASCDVVVFPNVFNTIAFEKIQENTPLIIEGVYKEGSIIASNITLYKGKFSNSLYEIEKQYENQSQQKNKSLKEKVSLLNFC